MSNSSNNKDIFRKLNAAYGEEVASAARTYGKAPTYVFTLIKDPKDPQYGGLYEPRTGLPLLESKIAELEQDGQIDPVKCIEDGERQDGRPNLIVWDGNRRVMHIEEINRRRAAAGGAIPPMLVKFDITRGKSIAELQLLKFGTKNDEPETPATLAIKIKIALDYNSEEKIRTSLGGMSKLRFDNLLAYLDLSAAGKKAVDEGRLHLANIPDIAALPRAEQAAAIEALNVAGATAVHEIRNTLGEVKSGKAPTPAGDRKKVWGRKQLTTLIETLDEGFPDTKETQVAKALAKLFLGDTRGFKRLAGEQGFDHLLNAVTAIDKDGEKRREAARKRHAKRMEKKANEAKS